MKTQIAIVGQGYVGLPLALAAAKAGSMVFGIDSDTQRIAQLKDGISPIEGITAKTLSDALRSKNYVPTGDYKVIRECSIILICVPTPLNKDYKPDLSLLTDAGMGVGSNLSAGSLIILESTVAPGTTRDYFTKIIEQASGLNRSDFQVAFSPERIDPLNKNWSIINTPKIVAGLTESAKIRAITFYSKFIQSIIPVQSLEVAETAKLLENTFRFINISFINEFSIFCHKLDVNVNEVIKAASSKPYGFMPFFPSLGIGGHCIPVDPIYLLNKAQELGAPLTLIDAASDVNKGMINYFVERSKKMLITLKDKRIVVIGLAYKPNVSDTRESPSKLIIRELSSHGAKVSWHDDLVKEWNGTKSVKLSSNFDLAIISTLHDHVDLSELEDVPILSPKE